MYVRTLYVRTDVHDVMAIKPNFLTSMGYHIFLSMVLRARAPSARTELRYNKLPWRALFNLVLKQSCWTLDYFLTEPTMPSITKGDSLVKMLTPVEYTTTIGSNITTIVGSNITFVCLSDGRPSPSVSWLKDDEPLNSTGTLFTMYAFDTNATGNYSCVAENLAGLTVAKSPVKIYGERAHLDFHCYILVTEKPFY